MPALTLKVFLRDLNRFGWNRRENDDLPYWRPEELTRGDERVRLVPGPDCGAPIGVFYFEWRRGSHLEQWVLQATAKPWINRYSEARMPDRIDIRLPAPRWSPPELNLHLWLCENYFSK